MWNIGQLQIKNMSFDKPQNKALFYLSIKHEKMEQMISKEPFNSKELIKYKVC